MKRLTALFAASMLIASGASAKKQRGPALPVHYTPPTKRYEAFRDSLMRRYEDFRRGINERYASHMEQIWSRLNPEEPIEPPVIDEPVQPPVYDRGRDERKEDEEREMPIEVPTVAPQPEPVKPNPDTPVEPLPLQNDPAPVSDRVITFDYLGSRQRVREPKIPARTGANERDAANAWRAISSEPANERTLADLLNLRTELKLNDWAYKLLIDDFVSAMTETDANARALLKGWLLGSSGYAMRLASDGGKLTVLFGSNHSIYDRNFFRIDGMCFYPDEEFSPSIRIFAEKYPGERPVSLDINRLPEIEGTSVETAMRSADAYAEFKHQAKVDKTALNFFSRYLPSFTGNDFMTRWAMLARAPFSRSTAASLLSSMRAQLAGKNETEGINMILNWVQTGFTYRLDEEVWGADRAFGAEESLYYPYCDCEDRSILFAKLVRELYGRPVALVYYPGHLATAVNFSTTPAGDYISINGERFTICDPTYINAGGGMTMTDMDNSKASVIVIR